MDYQLGGTVMTSKHEAVMADIAFGNCYVIHYIHSLTTRDTGDVTIELMWNLLMMIPCAQNALIAKLASEQFRVRTLPQSAILQHMKWQDQFSQFSSSLKRNPLVRKK